MKSMKSILAFLVLCLSPAIGSAQNQQWVYPPYNINMNGAAPVITTITGATAGVNISNGAYDANGVLLFYVKDLKVYKGANSQLLGQLPMPKNCGGGGSLGQGSEIEIVPVPGSGLSNKFYVIYNLRDNSGRCLIYAKITYSSGTAVSTPGLGTLFPSFSSPYVLEGGYYDAQGLAVSKLTLSNTTRYLFTVGFKGSPNYPVTQYNYGGLLRWTIDAAGIHNQVVIATTTDLNYLSGDYYAFLNYLTVSQMSLSDDQTRLAWGGGTGQGGGAAQRMLFEVKLNPANYSFVPSSFRQYFVPYTQASYISGVEYAAGSNKLYVSTRDGIYYLPTYGSTPLLIPGSKSLTQQPLSSMSGSQLQYVKSTGKIVGVRVTNTSANTGTLFSIDPVNNNISSISSTPVYANLFALPDTIK
jgi:hypothetical protein